MVAYSLGSYRNEILPGIASLFCLEYEAGL